MALQPMRIDHADARGRPLRRVEIAANGDVSERTLQDLLFRNPELLGIDSIGIAADRLIPVAQELATESGRIDNLYVDASGRLTIVETKLLKNPEAHRSVVAQIIDYAVDVARWSYEDLNRKVMEQVVGGSDLNAIVRPHVADDAALLRFQRRLADRLTVGDFDLLIVGDRISDKTQRLAESITAAPGLRFRLSLIELEIYRDGEGDWPWIVVPRLVERIVGHERLVVRIEHAEAGRPTVSVLPSKPRADADDEGGGRIGDAEGFFRSADLPPGFGELFRTYSERWLTAGGTLSPTARLFRWTWDQTAAVQDPLICTSAYVQLNRSATADDEVELSAAAFGRYRAAIDAVPVVRRMLAAGGRRVPFAELDADGLRAILEATLALADDLRARPAR